MTLHSAGSFSRQIGFTWFFLNMDKMDTDIKTWIMPEKAQLITQF